MYVVFFNDDDGDEDDDNKNDDDDIYHLSDRGSIHNIHTISMKWLTKTTVLTKFHENWAKNVTSKETAPPTGGNANVLTKVHEDLTKHVTSRVKTAPPPDINKTNVLTKVRDDLAKIVSSRVFTMKTAQPTGGHVFQRTKTTFDLNQHIN
ncbi:hypothetical protein DPMN_130269 [Dreissena polymorpha]|uniref:Uncharacterized protein n=1 Tax=Dreissena polymorpha TaxID=45954 RepID=A0A9D4H6B2_DREPO|nr:hypothetical protein DPMN_130269 [Dreissena polymorpha]